MPAAAAGARSRCRSPISPTRSPISPASRTSTSPRTASTAPAAALPAGRGQGGRKGRQDGRGRGRRAVGRRPGGGAWTSPLGVEGSLTNPVTPGGRHGGEAEATAVRRRVQGGGGQAAARGRQGPVRGRDRARR